MNAARHAAVKQLLLDAMEFRGQEREEFLSRQCAGDVDLRREVEELLTAAEDEDDFLEQPLFCVPAAVDVESLAGHRLGPYRLVGVIGRGGMGAVYSAEREDGEFSRQVAIKVMRRGLHSEELLAQFRRERQILASLAHPNIAMLLDGGATEDGTPYFVMEYIAGQSIDEWCQAHQLSLVQRLALFLPVCSAIAHAHRNMVVHGDIKPANILITAEGVPKLLDFGIARLMGREEGEGTPAAWTPKYASPEQLRGEAINTVSDVYSLGVLLGQLCVACCSSGCDVHAIVDKATREKPHERYPSVDALAADISRYLEGRPVAARAATAWYRAGKFVRRRRWAVAFAALFLMTLGFKIASDQVQARVLRMERDRANRRFADVRNLAHTLIFDIEQEVAELRGSTAVRAKLVSRALEYLDALSRESAGDLVLQGDLADAYEKLGDVQGRSGGANLGQTDKAADSYAKSIALREALVQAEPDATSWQRKLATSYGRYAAVLLDMGMFPKALEYDRKALGIRERVLALEPTEEHERAVAYSYTTLASALVQAGRWDEVLQARQRALELYKKIVARHPDNRSDRRGLALAESRLGGILLHNRNLPEATVHYREALRIESELAAQYPADQQIRMSLASAHVALGGALYEASDYPAALASYGNALRIQEEIAGSDARDVRSGTLLATTLQRVSAVYVKAGDAKQALASAERCLQLRRRFAAANPANAGARGDVATGMAAVGDAMAALRDRAAAKRWYGEALALIAELETNGQASAQLKADAKLIAASMAKAGGT